MEDEDIAPNIHPANPVGVGRKSCLHTILEYSVPILARLSARSAVCLWRNIFVFHFVGSSKYNIQLKMHIQAKYYLVLKCWKKPQKAPKAEVWPRQDPTHISSRGIIFFSQQQFSNKTLRQCPCNHPEKEMVTRSFEVQLIPTSYLCIDIQVHHC